MRLVCINFDNLEFVGVLMNCLMLWLEVGLFDCLYCFCCLFVMCFVLIWFGFILLCRDYLYGIFAICWGCLIVGAVCLSFGDCSLVDDCLFYLILVCDLIVWVDWVLRCYVVFVIACLDCLLVDEYFFIVWYFLVLIVLCSSLF